MAQGTGRGDGDVTRRPRKNRQHRHARGKASHSAALLSLPTELLSQIFQHLDLSTLATLCLVSRSVRRSVDSIGWATWLKNPEAQRHRVLSEGIPSELERKRPRHKERLKQLLQIDDAWSRRTFGARQIFFDSLPYPIGDHGRRHQDARGRSRQAFALVCLSKQGLGLAVRSCLAFWTSPALREHAGIRSRKPQVFQLFHDVKQRGQPSAWEDITAIEAVSEIGQGGLLLAVGRLNGRLELWKLPSRRDKQRRATLLDSMPGPNGRLSSVQRLSHLASHKLLAAVWKDGTISLLKIANFGERGQDSKLPEERPWTLWRRWRRANAVPWTIHLGFSGTGPDQFWLAVGCHGDRPVLLYRKWSSHGTTGASDGLVEGPVLEYEPLCEEFLDRKQLAVYAMDSLRPLPATSFPKGLTSPQELFIGCYDGSVRVLDLRDGLIKAVYRDVYDDSPVYSLALGIGKSSTSIAVGTARHGVVKIYEHPKDRQADVAGEPMAHRSSSHHGGVAREEGWSIFPPIPTASCPTYSIAGEHGRLFCAGVDRIWEFDARINMSSRKGESVNDETLQSVAWYQHREMDLHKTDEAKHA